jgi:hypothetical protein
MKVSFDFDSTLDKKIVQDYAQSLINKGHDIWICTSRTSPENSKPGWNDDLFLISDKLGIPRSQIIFCNYEDKSDHLNGKGFLWHLDDDWIELNQINSKTDVIGISVYGNTTWKQKCNKLLTKL